MFSAIEGCSCNISTSTLICFCNNFKTVNLTVVVDGVDEPDSYMCMVVRHQHNVKELLALWVQLSQTGVHSLQSLNQQIKEGKIRWIFSCARAYFCLTLTLTNGKAGPGTKGSCSCSIWYLRYSSTPFCSNTFCSRSVRNKTREETAMVTAFSGFGCRKRQEREWFDGGSRAVMIPWKHRRDKGFEMNGQAYFSPAVKSRPSN